MSVPDVVLNDKIHQETNVCVGRERNVFFGEESDSAFHVVDSPVAINIVKNVFDDISNFPVPQELVKFVKRVGFGWSQIPVSGNADFRSARIALSPFQEFLDDVQSLKTVGQ